MAVVARRLPDRDPAVYELECDGETVAHFRYDDGWRFLHDGPGSTVDRERLLSPAMYEYVEDELGLDRGALYLLLNAARAEPWEPLSRPQVGGGTRGRVCGRTAALDALRVWEGPWWCPACSTARQVTLDTNFGEPCCPRCGGPLEEQGTGDDDPDA